MKINLRLKYSIIKYLSFILTEFTIPLGTYIGYLLGTGNYLLAIILVPAEMALGFSSWVCWAWVLEQMTNKKIYRR